MRSMLEPVSRNGPVFHRAILADTLTPVSAFARVSRDSSRAFLLESVEGGEKIGRYSFIGVDPHDRFEGSFQEFRRRFPPSFPAAPGLPPFTGGGVGVFSYEMVRELEDLPSRARSDRRSPPAVMVEFYASVLAFDHLKHQIVILSHDSERAVWELEQRLRQPLHPDLEPLPLIAPSAPDLRQAASNFTREAFCSAVRKAQEYIRAGDIFQAVLSQRFDVEFPGDPLDVYRALRYINPSPYLFFLKMGSTCVAGSSPEMLLKVQGRDLYYRPIAGTRRRGRDQEEDQRLEQELFNDAKERAEHVMLVDLGRNDLGRVSEFGSVSVEQLMSLERYSHVVHLVSSLRGRLREGLDRFDALAACFPAGTVTGAPKVRAMEIIEELEPDRRGIYAGAIGYLDFSGNLDTCIAIRTIVLENGLARLQAGAGIVADSQPELEYQECGNKARALFQALEMALSASRGGRP